MIVTYLHTVAEKPARGVRLKVLADKARSKTFIIAPACSIRLPLFQTPDPTLKIHSSVNMLAPPSPQSDAFPAGRVIAARPVR